jgi:(p)ppGpp synthase/HD superfamily hydrolase
MVMAREVWGVSKAEATMTREYNQQLVSRAHLFADAAHAAIGQKRKYTCEPYIVHPRAVANLVLDLKDYTSEMIAAALLHDVVEDTKVALDLIEECFGREVRELVFWLTNVSRPEDGNRAVRKSIDREHIAQASAAAQTIKVADMIDNAQSIFKHDPSFARTYMLEIETTLDVLTKADPKLVRMLKDILEEHSGIIH